MSKDTENLSNTMVVAKQKAAAFDAVSKAVGKSLPLFLTSMLSTGAVVGTGVAVGAIPTNGGGVPVGIEQMQGDLSQIKASVSVIPAMQTDIAVLKTQVAGIEKRLDRMEAPR